jgi:hypothetical protein
LIATLEGLAGLTPTDSPAQPVASGSEHATEAAPLSQRHGLEIERARKSASQVWKI